MLGFGLSAAILFRRNEDRPAATTPIPSTSLTLRADQVPTPSPVVPRWQDRPAKARSTQPKPIEAKPVPVALRASGIPGEGPPPELPAHYQGSIESLAMSPPDARRRLATPPPIPKSLPPPERPLAKRPRDAERTHKIVDGDTLFLLAKRYLGRRDRHRELFEANRDVLKTPDVLPIGVVLKIPPRQVRPPMTQVRPPVIKSRTKALPTQAKPPGKVKSGTLVPVPPGAIRGRAAQRK